MLPENAAEARDLIYLANIDLLAAERLLRGDPPLVEPTLFHAQQAAEKALKAFLASRGQPFRRTHDLVALLTECERIAPDFSQVQSAVIALAPYAVAPRYDRVQPSQTEQDAERALQSAGTTYDFVLSQLPTVTEL